MLLAFCCLMQLSTYIRVVFSVVFVTCLLVPAAQAKTVKAASTTSDGALLTAVNDVRRAHNLRPLRVDTSLVRAARAYSTTLVRRNVFTHGALGSRLAGYRVRGPLYGENLAWGKGDRATARGIVRDWLASPGHRANLLRPGWTRIGIGSRVGSFRGYAGVRVVTADFAGS
jgi:uncharacterized protein YkwD